MYLATVMDLYYRRIISWHIDKRMTKGLISKALIKAYNLRRPPDGLVIHSDCGSQYTSRQYRQLLAGYNVRMGMGDTSVYSDTAVDKHFLGSIKYDWLLKVPQPTHNNITNDMAAYIRK